MKYIANNKLDVWIVNCQKRESKNSFLTILLTLFLWLAIMAKPNGDKTFGLSGLILISLFFIYTFIRAGLIFNRTIKEIEINELKIVFKTYRFRIFWLIPFCEKNIKTEYKGLKLSLNEFPLKENKKALPIECYLLVIKEVEYYLLYIDFDDSLIQSLSSKIQSK